MAKSFLDFLTDSLGPGISKIDTWLAKEEKPVPIAALLEGFVERTLVGELLPDGLWCCAKCDWVGDHASSVYDHAVRAHHAKISEEASLAGKKASMTTATNAQGERVPHCTKCGYTAKSADESASFYSRHIRECDLKFRDVKAVVCKVGDCGFASGGHDEFLTHLDEAHQESEYVELAYKPADVGARLKKSKHMKEELAPLGEWYKGHEKPEEAWLKRVAETLMRDGRFAELGGGWTLLSRVPPPAPATELKGTRKTVRTTKTSRTGKTDKPAATATAVLDFEVGPVPEHGQGLLGWERGWRVSHYVLGSAILVIDRYDREGTAHDQILPRLHERYELVERVTRYGVKETKNRARIGTRFDTITESDARGPILHARPAIEHLAAMLKVWPGKIDVLMGEVGLLAQNLSAETHQNTGLSEAHWDWLRILTTLPAADGGWVEPNAWLEAINKHLAKRGEEQLPNLGSTLVQHFLVPFGLMDVSKKKPAQYRLTPFADLCLTQ